MRVRGFLCADSHTLNETHRFLRNLIEPAVDQRRSTAGALLARYDALDLDSGTSSRTWPEIIPSRYHVRFIPGDLVHRAHPSFFPPADSKMPVLRGSCSRRYPILALLSPFIYRFSPRAVKLWRISWQRRRLSPSIFVARSGGNATFFFRFERSSDLKSIVPENSNSTKISAKNACLSNKMIF